MKASVIAIARGALYGACVALTAWGVISLLGWGTPGGELTSYVVTAGVFAAVGWITGFSDGKKKG
jgi:hypothetical protein